MAKTQVIAPEARSIISVRGRLTHELFQAVADQQASSPRVCDTGACRRYAKCLDAARSWGHMDGSRAQPEDAPTQDPPVHPRRTRRQRPREEPAGRTLPRFGAATGLRPEEWAVLERSDIDRRNGVLNVRRTLSGGEVVELAKTSRSRRPVPLRRRALDALDAIPPRLDTPRRDAELRVVVTRTETGERLGSPSPVTG